MNRSTLFIPLDQLQLLQVLIGQTWDHYGFPAGFKSGEMGVIDTFVQTDNTIVTFEVDLTDLAFEGFADEYTTFRIHEGSEERHLAIAHGHLYHHFRGGSIVDVTIVRDTTRGYSGESMTFEFVRDVGIIIELTNGWIGIIGGGPWGLEIHVTHSTKREELHLWDRSGLWESDLMNRVESEREFVALETAMRSASTDDQS